jgi:hypothetical protein
VTRRHDRTAAAGIAAALRSLVTTTETVSPKAAAGISTDVVAEGGVLDTVRAVLKVTCDLIMADVPLDHWAEPNPEYRLCHRLADTAEYLYDQTQELRDAPQILRGLSDPASSACRPEPDTADQARPAPSASPLPPPAVTPVPALTSPRTTR